MRNSTKSLCVGQARNSTGGGSEPIMQWVVWPHRNSRDVPNSHLPSSPEASILAPAAPQVGNETSARLMTRFSIRLKAIASQPHSIHHHWQRAVTSSSCGSLCFSRLFVLSHYRPSLQIASAQARKTPQAGRLFTTRASVVCCTNISIHHESPGQSHINLLYRPQKFRSLYHRP